MWVNAPVKVAGCCAGDGQSVTGRWAITFVDVAAHPPCRQTSLARPGPCRRCFSACSKVSTITALFPEPDTPVTQVSAPRGKLTVRLRRLSGAARGAYAQLAQPHGSFPSRVRHLRDSRVGLGKVEPDRRHPVARAELACTARGQPAPNSMASRAPMLGQDHRHQPVPHRPHAAIQPSHLHRHLHPYSRSLRRLARIQGARLPRRPLLVQHEGGSLQALRAMAWPALEMRFLPDVYVQCEACGGRRYSRETLEVECRQASIADVLDMTVGPGLQLPAKHSRATTRARNLARGRPGLHRSRPVTRLRCQEAKRSG